MTARPVAVEMVLDRDIFDESVRAIARRATVLDLGGHSPLQKGLSRHRAQFAGTRYICTDLAPAPGLDFVGDAQRVPLRDQSVDAVICHSVLEHVFEPTEVAREIFRILRPGGVAFVYVPFLYSYHGDPKGKGPVDCYRFSLDAIRYLFRDFELLRVQPIDRAVEASLRLLLARYMTLERPMRRVGRVIDRLRGPRTGLHQASGYNIWLEKAGEAILFQ